MNTSIDFLCDLWMALFQFSNDENINEKECTALVDIMSLVEKVLVLKLQDDVPNIVKILAVLTDFGDSELPHSMDSLLRAYEPDLDNPIKKVA
ncbi:hypothetical protein KAE70_06560 [Bartonella henselae]|uniref:hypothetical protein n=1 Tax=Bartonella henselae TaxID=38323 RepID=UPI00096970F7|nr:hypothetical protein [Bartonella henselae]OLL51075.1 hypothetical protein AT243_07685 [Bartonella henselae]OLL52815.1 hypothetical protein AT239_03435 [Bartonella henselae]OLL55989.1 hypothetical protein AT240_06490 [Bartonella henselae]UJM32712.1 hypothetical protein KAE70_06560 [Bartonella henselae]UJM42964.1 hypothetical protein KAE73_06545 [Bartonella henselae]